jgi:lipid intermediate transporter
LLLFDVYLTWARIEKSSPLASTALSNAPIVLQYLFFLSLNALATLVHHLTVRLLASILVPPPSPPSAPNETACPSTPSTPGQSFSSTPVSHGAPTLSASPNRLSRPPSRQDTAPNLQRPPPPVPVFPSPSEPGNQPPPIAPPIAPPLPPPLRRVSTIQPQIIPLPPPSPASPNAISTALFVSSCAKLFPILLVIWGSEGNNVTETGSLENGTPGAAMPVQQSIATQSSLSTASSSLASSLTSLAIPTSVGESIASSLPTSSSSLLARFFPFSTTAAFTSNLHSLLSFPFLGAANTHLVLLNNVEALCILLNCGYLRAVFLAVAGQAARWSVEKFILGIFGLH